MARYLLTIRLNWKNIRLPNDLGIEFDASSEETASAAARKAYDRFLEKSDKKMKDGYTLSRIIENFKEPRE